MSEFNPATSSATTPKLPLEKETFPGGSLLHSRSRRSSHKTDTDSAGFESDPDDWAEGGSSSEKHDVVTIPDDISATGFAVASSIRNADFHELFSGVEQGDHLIEDYGCALQRDILLQGRMYISENHVCFHANIFGWITDVIIPLRDITNLERKMTAFVIPNAIHISTKEAKYTFASLLSRDPTFYLIYKLWRHARPELAQVIKVSSRTPTPQQVIKQNADETAELCDENEPDKAATQCACGKNGEHYGEQVMDTVLLGTPDKIYNLIFASEFANDFMRNDCKLLDVQMSEWTSIAPGSQLKQQNLSYIKPLNMPLGPAQTKCELRHETVHYDAADYISTITTTRTPEVQSGNIFVVKTRTCITWASAITSRVQVTTTVEWTSRSFIKKIVDKSAISGQVQYHTDLGKAMRRYINEHRAEFTPDGAVLAPEAIAATTGETRDQESEKRELVKNSPSWLTYAIISILMLGFCFAIGTWWSIIFIVVVGNIWAIKFKLEMKEEDHRRLLERIQPTVISLQEATRKMCVRHGMASGNTRDEVAQITQLLDGVEARVKQIREALISLDGASVVTEPSCTC